MNLARRILFYVRPYRGMLGLSVLSSVFFSIFSGLSIYLTIPLLETLFQGPEKAASVVSAVPSILPGWLVGLKGPSQGGSRRWSSPAIRRCRFATSALSWSSRSC